MILEAASDLIEGALSVEAASLRLHAGSSSCRCHRSRQISRVRSDIRDPVVYQKPELTVQAVETGQREVRSRCAARATASASIGSDLP